MKLTLRTTTAHAAGGIGSLLSALILWTATALSQGLQWGPIGPWGGEVLALERVGSTLLAGTGGSGIFRSTDNGSTWSHAEGGELTEYAKSFITHEGKILKIGELPARSTDEGRTWSPLGTRLYLEAAASLGDTLVGATFTGAIYTSTDFGDTWQSRGTIASGYVNVMAIHNRDIFVGTDYGLFRSNDLGASWTRLIINASDSSVRAIIATDQVVIASAGPYPHFTKDFLYRSTDNGATWTKAGSGVSAQRINSIIQTGTEIYVSGGYHGGIFRTRNNGVSWTRVTGPFPDDMRSLLTFGDTILAGSEGRAGGGIFRSTDRGATWAGVNQGFTSIGITALAEANGNLVASAGGYGIFRTSDDGVTWQSLMVGDRIEGANVLASCNGYLLAGSGEEIYRSSDGGFTWAVVDSNLYSVNSFTISSGGDDVVAHTQGGATGISRLHRSTDCGATWRALPETFGDEPIVQVTYHGADLIAVGRDHVYRSTDGGATWSSRGSGLAGRKITALCSSGDALLVGTEHYNDPNAFYRSTDDGATWTPVGNNVSGAIMAITTVGEEIYAAASTTLFNEVFLSNDHGATWKSVSRAPENRTIRKLLVRGSTLFIGTYENGIFRASLPAGVAEAPVDAGAATLAPNPTRERATLAYTVRERARVTIELFNALGDRVASHLDRDEEPGEHRATIELGGLPQGDYLCRLTIGTDAVVRPVRVVR